MLVALLAGSLIGLGSVRRPYGEVASNETLLPSRPETKAMRSRLRIATFNIHSGRGVDGEENLGRTAAVMRGFDLIGLNEVRGPDWLRRTSQAEELGAQLGMASIFGPSERRWYITSFGNGLLSRFPILSWRSRPMRVNGKTSYRAVILARLALGDRSVNVVVAHVERGEARDAQLSELRDLLAHTPAPALLLGDFNRGLHHAELRRMAELPGVTYAVPTQPGSRPRHADHIYAKGFVVDGGGIVPTDASDHPVVWTELEDPVLADRESGQNSSAQGNANKEPIRHRQIPCTDCKRE